MPTIDPTHIVTDLLQLQSKLQQRLTGALTVHGIHISEYLIMQQLQQAPAMQLQRKILAQKMQCSATHITKQLNPMVKIGLIHKETNSANPAISLITLTAAGNQLLQNADLSLQHAATTILKPLNHQQQQNLHSLTKRLL